MSDKKPGCCGDAVTRIDIVKNACRNLWAGHKGVAELYETIVKDLELAGVETAEIEPFRERAREHFKMAEESLKVAELTE